MFFLNPHPRTSLPILEREGGRERVAENERDKHISSREKHHLSVALGMRPREGAALLPGLYPDRGLNPQHFGLRDISPTDW